MAVLTSSLVRVYPLPILNMAVLHFGQVPLIAGLPFFMVYGFAPLMSRLSRHFTQYPIVIIVLISGSIIENLLNFFHQEANLRSQLLCCTTVFLEWFF